MYFYLFSQEIHLRVLPPPRAFAGREDEAVNEVYPKNSKKKLKYFQYFSCVKPRDAFEILMRSSAYFHRGEFSEMYRRREEKKGRAMIAR